MQNPTKSRQAFTLVELLVVIGIIAVLLGILLPSLSRARVAASGIKCAANMRGIGQQILMYANNNKGWMYPPKADGSYRGSGEPDEKERWPAYIFDDLLKNGTLNVTNHYSPEFMRCPADDRGIIDGGNADPYGSYHSYNYNMGFFPEGAANLSEWLRYGQQVASGQPYSDVCLMVEKQQTLHDWHMNVRKGDPTGTKQQWYTVLFGQKVSGPTWDPKSPGPNNDPKYKHGKYGNNYLYLDWSVRHENPEITDKNMWAPHDYQWSKWDPTQHQP